MAIKTIRCTACSAKFKAPKKLNKPYIGMYKGKPVFHWHYTCRSCEHVHTVRYWNEYLNPYFDKVKSLRIDIWWHSRDEEKVEQLMNEYEIAQRDMDREYEILLKEMDWFGDSRH